MKAFNNSELEQKVDQEVLKILDDAYATDALIIWVVDLFSFNGTLNSEIAKKVKKLNVIVVGNKRDLFPANVKEESLVEYLIETFNAYGIKPKSVRLLGAANKIDSKEFENTDVHVHVPEGAVPKDGPSAGVAITCAIISCLSGRPVNPDVAMTGEVTLRGNALPIGGIREKSLAAMRSGIKTIIIPRKNERDLIDIPDEVKNKLNIVLMDTVDDALKVALID